MKTNLIILIICIFTSFAGYGQNNKCLTKNDVIDYTIKILDDNCIIEGAEEWNCNEPFFRYIPLAPKEDIQLILVPMDCGDFENRYYLLTVKDNKIISNLYVEGEWYEEFDNVESRNTAFTSFEIDDDYNIIVTTVWIRNNIIVNGDKETYQILYTGEIEEVK